MALFDPKRRLGLVILLLALVRWADSAGAMGKVLVYAAMGRVAGGWVFWRLEPLP
jgi:hypothetical protein